MPIAPLRGILKRIVTRSGSGGVAAGAASAAAAASSSSALAQRAESNSAAAASSSSSGSGSRAATEAMKGLVTKFSDTFLSEFQEREWRCACGHIFRAAGEWSPCEPARCEAPACPCPTFFLSGPGRELLHNGKVPPPMLAALPAPSGTSQQAGGARKPPSCGNRFR